MKRIKCILFAMLIGFSFAGNSLAQDLLGYDEAVKTALQNNLSLERTKDDSEKIDEALTQGVGTVPQIPDNAPGHMKISDGELVKMSNTLSTAYEDLIRNQNLTRTSIEVQKDAITLGVKNAFVTIEQAEKNAELLQDKINNMRDTLNIDIIRYKVGLMSKIDFDKKNLDYEKLLSDQKENKLKIDMAYKDLENILGTKNDKKISYLSMNYTPLSELGISLDAQIGRASSEAPMIIAQNNAIQSLEDKIKYNLLGEDGEALPTKESEIDVKIKNTDVRLGKQDIKTAVINTQNTINNMELQIKNLQDQKTNLQQSISQMQTAVKVGVKTKLELDNLKLALKEIDLGLENLKQLHQILLERYQKPYLLSLGGVQ